MNGPELPAPPWQRYPPERTRRRGREPITREAIVDAALRLLDRDGLDELSMRRLADELDTGPASLYWHVGSKDGLLELVFDRLIGEVELPAPEPARWQEQVKEVATKYLVPSNRTVGVYVTLFSVNERALTATVQLAGRPRTAKPRA